MADAITFTVKGMAPAPQGSKRHLGNGVMVESCKRVKPWRAMVTAAAVESGAPICSGPVSIAVTFLFARPKSHYGKRGLKPSAPRWHAVRPDNDKLVRGVCDALTGALIADDSRVVTITSKKRFCTGDEQPGAIITVIPL